MKHSVTTRQAAGVKSRLQEQIHILTQLDHGKATRAIIIQWLIIAATMTAAVWLHHWAFYLLAVVIIGGRQHALAVLMHEASHFRLYNNRFWNDFVGDFFLGFPLGVSTRLYRYRHLQHHRYTNTENDPDWCDMAADEDWVWPKPIFASMRLFAADLLGLKSIKSARIFMHWSPWLRVLRVDDEVDSLTPRERWSLLAVVAIAIIAISATGGFWYFFLLWIVPQLTVLTAAFRLRAIAEHLEVEGDLHPTRHTNASMLERAAIAPLNINYHLAHHFYPTVPFYNLPPLHELLMQQPEFQEKAHVTDSYTGLRKGVLAELTRAPAP
jgi:fatty acid desaturase